ncbi:MAG: hypothetical protein R2818_14690 [Flavobacteriales bacterium]
MALGSPATAAIGVFDYDGERDYRIVLPTADGKVLNYSLDGAKVQGWDPPKLPAPATNAVQHIRIRNKDYLVVVDGDGGVHLLDRRGSDRERSSLKLGHAPSVRTMAPGLDLMSTRILWADTAGAMHEGRLDGAKSTLVPAQRGKVEVGAPVARMVVSTCTAPWAIASCARMAVTRCYCAPSACRCCPN